MILPEAAPVRPRVISRQTGEIILLQDEIRRLLETKSFGQIWLIGPPGAGKTTALRHLAAVFSDRASQLKLVDGPSCNFAKDQNILVICTAITSGPGIHRGYRLGSWSNDDLIEYLLCKHKESCGSIMDRVRAAPDRDLPMGNPELWVEILGRMASDESILNVRSALMESLVSLLPKAETRKLVQAYSLNALMGSESLAAQSLSEMNKRGVDEAIVRLIRHRIIQVLLAAEEIAADLAGKSLHVQLGMQLPREVVREVANQIQSDSKCIQGLQKVISKDTPELHPMALSIMHWVDSTWVPAPGSVRLLAGAYLDRVNWPQVDLEKANLREADLSHANLEHANLCGADVGKASFQSASLRAASLRGILANETTFAEADLSGIAGEKAQIHSADLRGANLEDAVLIRASFHGADLKRTRFGRADLRQANLRATNIEEADFSGANLEGACLSRLKLTPATFIGSNLAKADLSKCDLENMELPGASFRGANLEGALLTGSSMPNADFSRAHLRHTGLADINWEGAILRNADLTGATFHMGSSRSGLVGSPIASEGSRTGFYTDDYTEQDFKAPEEIRKANLCGADLRGAKIEGVDFYLVDLRNALYDADQERHFRRCGAILESRAEA
jgi:uncharacterized protein YjbI with pentapeptide repeats